MKYQRIDNLKTELQFGKYKGFTIKEVLTENPKYIEWCLMQKLMFFNNENDFNELLKQTPLCNFSLESIKKHKEFISDIKRFGHFDDLEYVDKFELLDEKLFFGKYKGKSLRFVAENDPRYIEWCFINKLIVVFERGCELIDKTNSEGKLISTLIYEETWNELINLIETKHSNFRISEKAIKIMTETRSIVIEEEKEFVRRDNERMELENELKERNNYEEGDWGGLYGDEAEAGYWNTQ